MSLLRKALLVNTAEFVCFSFSVVQAAILARVLGPAGVGQYDLIRSAMMLAPQLCCFGLPLSFLYYSQHNPQNTKKYLMNTIWSLLFLSTIGGAAICLVVLFKKDYFGLVPWFALLGIASYAPILLAGMTARNILLIKIEAGKLSLMRISSILGGLVLIIVLYAFGCLRVPQALLCFVFAAFVSAAVGWTWTQRQIALSVKPSWKTIRQLGFMGTKQSSVDLMVLVNAQLNILIVRYLLDDFESVGYFSRALRVGMLAVLAGQAILPLLFSRWASFPKEELSAHVEKVMRFASTVSIFMIAGILLFGKWMILLLYGSKFLPALRPMIVLVPGAVLYLLSRALIYLLGSRGIPEVSALMLLIAAAVNATLSFLLIPRIGILGAAWASTCSNIVLLLLLALIVRKKYKVSIENCLFLTRRDIGSISKSLFHKASIEN